MPKNIQAQLKEKDQQIALLHQITRIVSETASLDELLEKLTRMIVHEIKANSALIYLFDENKEELVLRGAHNPHPKTVGRIKLKLGEGITGWVAEKKKVVAIPRHASEDPRFKFFNNLEEDRYEAFLSVPIILKDELVGVLNIAHRKAHIHTPGEIELAKTIAHEIAGAIAHAKLHHQAKRKTQQIEALTRMSASIAQGSYLREILQLIVSMTAEMLGSKICSLMLLDDKGRELKIEATQSLSEEYKSKPPVKVAGSVSGRAIQEKRTIFVADVTLDPQYTYPDLARKENLKSVVVVPMMVKERPIGVVNCYTTDSRSFSPEDTQVLQAVANQAAIAIEHTRVVEKALQAQEALETRKTIERAKGLLMRQQGLSEDAAYRIIQRQAMDHRKSMKEVAEAVILSDEIRNQK
jgi:signal transduction protein with GAF and PtsI domain